METADPLTLPGHRIAVGPLGHSATLSALLAALARKFANRTAFSLKTRSITYAELEQDSAHSIEPMNQPLAAGQSGSFGIVDPHTGLDAQEGELWVRGYSLMQGLYKREREEVFEPDGYYRAGDLCLRRADGHLVFKGRLNEMIKTRGANVSPREVELLLEGMPEIRRAAVLGLGDPVRGQHVAAAIVLVPGASVEVETLRARLAAQLSSFKVPSGFHFLEGDELPLTASDKIRKPELQRLIEARDRMNDRPGATR